MQFVVKLAVLLSCLPLPSAGEFHTLQYVYTATSGISDIPDFISVGILDGVEISYYDPSLKRNIPKQDWMGPLDQEYWNSETGISKNYEQIFKVDLDILGKRFNHTKGVHVLQKRYGCEWDDVSGATGGHEAFGYDGEDFLTLDLKSMTWIAPVQHAVPTKHQWDETERYINRYIYFKETCADWVKKYVAYGSSTLGMKVPPQVSLFQKDSSAVCHATGFYPEGVVITWKRDGEEMQEDVDVGETLPNMDGTFQKRAVLTVSPEEWKKNEYTCEVTHKSGEPIIKILIIEDDYKADYKADASSDSDSHHTPRNRADC
ncbi:class I histocompatibility antigen, F10 alpha chain-like isoform X2 [Sardina pilchardus]|uniref:class I histocompatibility antigen, F10 alpha chain-like isoform X2 n=1 Tax=Sardina pilchardus TaxID=27697 RepID=UPI002E0E500C